MNLPRPHAYSAYMQFSKLKSSAKYNLATSGVMNCSLRELGMSVEELAALEIHGSTVYGYPPLLDAIAKMKGVEPEWVVEAAGTAMANHLALSALFAPGDEVLIEEPTYGLLLSTALYLGAKVRRFPRRVEDNYALDPERIAKQLTSQTRLIVLTNMHNPTSALASEERLRAIGKIAEHAGAWVLVDEVYLEALPDRFVPSAIHLGPQFVVTGSLTKGYGLGGLRCGWILAEPSLAKRIWRMEDLFAATPVHIAELLSVHAIGQLAKFKARAEELISVNRQALVAQLEDHPAIEWTMPEVGTTVFPRLRSSDVDSFCAFLRERYETSVAPGVYFERPDYFRIGLAGEPEMTREALARLGEALHAWSGASTLATAAEAQSESGSGSASTEAT